MNPDGFPFEGDEEGHLVHLHAAFLIDSSFQKLCFHLGDTPFSVRINFFTNRGQSI